jgi:spermidine synthase
MGSRHSLSRRERRTPISKRTSIQDRARPSAGARSVRQRIDLPAVCLCFILSGMAALIYQVAWTRKFALLFGTSELAVAAVLAAYMGGLALGAWLIQRRIRRVQRPLLWYAGLELGIAVAALALLPAGLWLAQQLLVLGFGSQPAPPDATFGATSLFCLAAAFAILLVPTTLMGATLPLLARHAVHSERQIGRRIGLLYACNTAGAVAGALGGALLLLPQLGLTTTTWIAAGVNLLVALLALALARRAADHAPDPQADAHDASAYPPQRLRAGASPLWVLPLMSLSGAVSFLHEVLWTRMLGHVLGSSIHAFGVMLASFLSGLALGGGLGAVLARRRDAAARWLAISELAAGLAAVAAWYALQLLGPGLDSLAQRVGFGFALLFPLAFAIGLTYPLAVRVLARSVADAAPASAQVYTWNTVGAILGAIVGGFLIVPALRYEGAVQLAVVASCALAGLACFVLFEARRRFSLPVTVAALATAALFSPAPPEALLRYSPLRVAGTGELVYYDVGRSAAVVGLRLGDQISVRTNGLTDAIIDMRGAGPQLYAEAWMAPLAVLARPQLRDMLVVGLGGGRVLEAVPPSVRGIDVIELEDKVIAANRALALRRAHDPLGDPRVALIVNDARGALQLTAKKYDAVLSQPSHPWTAGASHLYTREFMQQAQAHLNPGGVFVQWMNVDFLDEPLLRSLLATLNSVYAHVRVYRPTPPTLLFLASDAPLEPERHVAATRAAFAAAPGHYGRLALNVVEDLLVALTLDTQGSRDLAAGAPVITDDANRFAVSSVFDSRRNIGVERLGELLAPHDPLLQAPGFVWREPEQRPAFDYIARRMHAFVPSDVSARIRMQRLADLTAEPDLQAYIRSLAASDDMHSSATRRLLAEGARAHPDSALLRDALLEGRLAGLNATGTADATAALAGPSADALMLQAAQRAARADWNGVAALDAGLALIPWTSLWNSHALRLRIEWRAHSHDAASHPGLGADSIAMIDRLNVYQPQARLYLLRALSAGDEPHVLLESLFRYTLFVLQGGVTVDDATRREFATLRQQFEQLHFDDPVDQHHYSEVHATVAAAAALLR